MKQEDMKMMKTKTAVPTHGRRTARFKRIRFLTLAFIAALLFALFVCPVFAEDEDGGGGGGGAGDVAGAIEDTWNTAKGQVQAIVNNVVFPVIDMVLAIMFFVKLGTSYFDYRKHGQFEFTAPCILFACLIFTLTAPLYIWTIL